MTCLKNTQRYQLFLSMANGLCSHQRWWPLLETQFVKHQILLSTLDINRLQKRWTPFPTLFRFCLNFGPALATTQRARDCCCGTSLICPSASHQHMPLLRDTSSLPPSLLPQACREGPPLPRAPGGGFCPSPPGRGVSSVPG